MQARYDYEAMPQLVRKMLDVSRIDGQIARYRMDLRQVETQLGKCTSRLTGLPRGGQGMSWDDLITRKDKLTEEIRRLSIERDRLAQDIAVDPDCDLLELDEYRVLCLRYMAGLKLSQIARELHMGRTTVYDYEQRALLKIRTNPNKSEQIRTK